MHYNQDYAKFQKMKCETNYQFTCLVMLSNPLVALFCTYVIEQVTGTSYGWFSGTEKSWIRREHYLCHFCGRVGLLDRCIWKWSHMWVLS